MIQITPQMRIWLAVEPVDFRRESTAWRKSAGRSSNWTRWRVRWWFLPVGNARH